MRLPRTTAIASALLFSAPAFADPDADSVATPVQADESEHTDESDPANESHADEDPDIDRLIRVIESQQSDLKVLQGQLEEVRSTVAEQAAEISALRDTDQRFEAALESPERVEFGGAVTVAAGEVVDRAVAYGEDVVVFGHVSGEVRALGGNVYIKHGGVVGGDATALGGDVIVEPGGELHGNRNSMRGSGSWFANATPEVSGLLSALYHRLVFLLSFAGAGVLVIGLWPQRVANIARYIEERPFRSALSGTFITSLLCGLGGLLFFTLVAPAFLWGALAIAWFTGFIGVCQAVGDRLPFEKKHNGRWMAFLVGSLLVAFATSLPVLGWIGILVASTLGIGAALNTRFGAR